MLQTLEQLPPDSILGLAAACAADPNPQKVDLSVGIYMDEAGVCPVFGAVREAQRLLCESEVSKAYLPPAGDARFNTEMVRLVLGDANPAIADARVSSIATPGGCGALRIAAEVIYAANPSAKVWVSDPTWPVHLPLLGSVGLTFETYRYYDSQSHGVDFDAMVMDLKQVRAGDVVLLHGCCHNPSGADLSQDQWRTVGEMAQQQGFMPLLDIAYQGLGDGLDADAAGLRELTEQLPEMIIAASCSKNLGLYRERTGAALFVCSDSAAASAALSQATVAARRMYSMPPAHGSLLAGLVLSDEVLRLQWEAELRGMCERMQHLRSSLHQALVARNAGDFAFIEKEKGMFSFLGLSEAQARRLRSEHSVYLLDSSRINVAGINAANLDYLADAIASVV